MKKTILIALALLTLGFVTARAEGATQAEMDSLHCGDKVTITAEADPGYEFYYWEDDSVAKTIPAEREIVIDSATASIEYVAVFKKKTVERFTITVKVKEGQGEWGRVEKESFTGPKDSTVVLTAIETSPSCYVFSHWASATGDTLAITKVYEHKIAADATIYAVFKQKEFTVKVSTQGNGKISIVKKED